MCWCTPSKRTPWCPDCNRIGAMGDRLPISGAGMVQAQAAMMHDPQCCDPVPYEPRSSDVPYFWLVADAEASRTTRVVVDPKTIETRNVLEPLPDDPVTDALPSERSWPVPDDFWP